MLATYCNGRSPSSSCSWYIASTLPSPSTLTLGYPSVTLLDDGRVLAMYHEHDDNGDRPLQFVASTHFRIAD